MDKLIDYICDELETLERKADKDGKLSMAEVQYVDTLAHAKKNLLKAEEMSEGSYAAGEGSYATGGSYARGGGGRGGRGRRGGANQYGSYARGGSYADGMYSRESGRMVDKLRDLMEDADDGQIKHDIGRLISKIEERA